MGIHYLNPAVLDATLDPLCPEFLVYRQTAAGTHELMALEYVVFAPVWDAGHAQPPVLFGHPLHLVRTPNRYGTPDAFYELHVWAHEHNPNGLFNDWNPKVRCVRAARRQRCGNDQETISRRRGPADPRCLG